MAQSLEDQIGMSSHSSSVEPIVTVAGSATLKPGKFGDYLLLQLLGKGSQGEVWLAQDSIGRNVAVKQLSGFQESKQVHREVQALKLYQGLSDEPHLLRVLHIGTSDAGVFYSMELADSLKSEGGKEYVPMSLAHQLSSTGAMSAEISRQIIVEVLDGVAALHSRGLLHRDIKPANILRVNGVWKLADIGLLTEDRADVTALGTLEFMAPNGDIDKKSDLYACGKVLYCVLTGLPARSFPTLPQTVLSNPSQLVQTLNAAVNRACALDPVNRFDTATEFKAALDTPPRRVIAREHWLGIATACTIVAITSWGVLKNQQSSSETSVSTAQWQVLFNGVSIGEWDKPEAIHGTWIVKDGAIQCVRDDAYKLLRLKQDFGPGTLRVVVSPDHDGARFGVRYACDQVGGGPLFMVMGDKYTWVKGYQKAYPPDQPGNWFSFPGPIPAPGQDVVLEVEWGPKRHQLRANGQVLYDLPPSDAGGPVMLHVWAGDSATFRKVEYRPGIEK